MVKHIYARVSERLPRRPLRRVPGRRLPPGARRACSTDPESVHAAPGPAASGPHDTAELVLSSTALFAPCLALLCRPRCIGRAKVRLHSGQERRVTVTLPGRWRLWGSGSRTPSMRRIVAIRSGGMRFLEMRATRASSLSWRANFA